MPPGVARHVTLSFLVSKPERDRLGQLVANLGISRSALIRRAIHLVLLKPDLLKLLPPDDRLERDA